ncbi:MAG: methylmalonyl-CoA epimerase [Sodaliphilus sp.]|jgi:methylmalonyl-CoA/ethylmalonyl-CoA epimerase|nr:methylmalonyl-CoA epimerase [Muribaculaceae bacterium]MCI6079537.1 methylmalonyl-CoA epimerase [Bacteroidales bacterium]MDY2591408.1 methylmalonyl-CoA epimerase [Sodaliphilus sp.]HAO63431.1 methylmalonyl-CoA epimerase [Porphyromonadaceae bacterium]MCI6145513.1 methylmalonyl-CoA epimerase [Bacteroidales bacterium]
MQISHIEHVGIAVTSLEEAIPFYERLLNTKCYKVEEVEEQHVRTAFLKIGEVKIELLEATSEESAIAKFIAKNGGRGGIQHIAFAVEDGLQAALDEIQANGDRVIDAAPRGGADGLHIAFLHPKSTCGALVELCENPNK